MTDTSRVDEINWPGVFAMSSMWVLFVVFLGYKTLMSKLASENPETPAHVNWISVFWQSLVEAPPHSLVIITQDPQQQGNDDSAQLLPDVS